MLPILVLHNPFFLPLLHPLLKAGVTALHLDIYILKGNHKVMMSKASIGQATKNKVHKINTPTSKHTIVNPVSTKKRSENVT